MIEQEPLFDTAPYTTYRPSRILGRLMLHSSVSHIVEFAQDGDISVVDILDKFVEEGLPLELKD